MMDVGILHLTDLHLNPKDNFIIDKIEEINNALKIEINQFERLYIVVTGDIVDRGAKEAYNFARKFLLDLKESLETINKHLVIKFIIVPGNHDCNFKEYDNQLRKNAIKSINYDSIGEDNSVLDVCLSVQEDFWTFYNDLDHSVIENKLFFQVFDSWGDKSICFNCLNTAWMSQEQEAINLFFPVKRFEDQGKQKQGNINISVYHHPISWFTPQGSQNNRKELQNFLEDISSIMLYGHEHDEEHNQLIQLDSGKESLYFSGKILQDNGNLESGFQLLLIDSTTKDMQLKQYLWQKDMYTSNIVGNFKLNGQIRKKFKHNEKFIENLNTLKVPITIENNKDLKLSDIYVFPDLEKADSDNSIDSFYDSEKLLSEKNFNTCIIEGENQSGKTSLISMLYIKSISLDFFPVLITSRLFKPHDIDKVIKKEFLQQYDAEELDFERYHQYDKLKKIVFLDDLQESSFNTKTIKKIIEELECRFEKVIIFSKSLFGLISSMQAEYENLIVFSISPLGYKKRNKLIENFHKITISKYTITDEILLEKTKQSFMQVESVLGDKLMPSYPIFVLSILQTIIYVKPINLEQTSYGYCYQSLIHIALVKNANIENENIDTYFNFLSEFAFFLYKNDYVFFDENILNKFFSQYHNQYHISFSFDKLKDTLLKSMIIINQEDQFKFSYKYIYYFLVARKLAEIINKEEGKAEIKNLCANLHKERNANILIFVAHHTKDDYLIEEATFTTMIPFEDVVPITLEPKKDYFYKLIENIVKEISSDIIESNNNPIESRNKILDSQDMLERNSEKHKEDIEKIEQDEDFMSFMMPFYQSFRALQIVGQIVRNRKGSIQTDQLITMIEALYNTAFRTISFWGETLIKTKLNLINSLSSRVNEGDSNKAIEQKINDFFQIAALEICLGVFSQLVHSVGHKDLKDLFDEVAKNIDTPAADIVTFSINSYYGKLSTNDLSKIVVKYEKNPVAMEIIKVRVKSYLYNNYVDYKKKQSFADILKMQLRVLPPR